MAMTHVCALFLWLAVATAGSDALQSAWSAVADMEQMAKTPDERRFAAQHRRLVAAAEKLVTLRAAAQGKPTAALKQAEMSFNLQYLQLQSQMQHENRSYTAISNIMKTKHDTVKNAISNVR